MDNECIKPLDGGSEIISLNQLNKLGNQAINLKLIAGHGHHQGRYEIIHQGEILTMTSKEAMTFLQQLVQAETSPPST